MGLCCLPHSPTCPRQPFCERLPGFRSIKLRLRCREVTVNGDWELPLSSQEGYPKGWMKKWVSQGFVCELWITIYLVHILENVSFIEVSFPRLTVDRWPRSQTAIDVKMEGRRKKKGKEAWEVERRISKRKGIKSIRVKGIKSFTIKWMYIKIHPLSNLRSVWSR